MNLFKRIVDWWRMSDTPPQTESRTVRPVYMSDEEYEAATERWRARNERERLRGCKCGKPNTRCKYYGGNIGAVPVEFWSCDEDFGVTQWSGRPAVGREILWAPTNNLTDTELRAQGYWW
jgi:hypothetical protein